MKLADLLAQVSGQLPEPRRKAVEALVAEYGAGENLRFLLALAAGASKRERRLVRLLLNALDELDERKAG
jgi:hypothetical protein